MLTVKSIKSFNDSTHEDIPLHMRMRRRGSGRYQGNGLKFKPYPSPSCSLSGTELSLDKMKKDTRKVSEVILNDIKCEHCGKGYKHISCLTKHRWEHTVYFNPKLSISKHQQVQLLEAASILIQMNQSSNFKSFPFDILFKKHDNFMDTLNDSDVNLEECVPEHHMEDNVDHLF